MKLEGEPCSVAWLLKADINRAHGGTWGMWRDISSSYITAKQSMKKE
jgi:hypothetical protein